MKTIVGIATTGKRERLLENTINSLKGQVDIIYIYNNLVNFIVEIFRF